MMRKNQTDFVVIEEKEIIAKNQYNSIEEYIISNKNSLSLY